MELAERLVRKAATECSVCKEALHYVVNKRKDRGESLREVAKDIAQAINIEAGSTLFTPDQIRQMYLRAEKKIAEAKGEVVQNVPPQKSKKTGENTSLQKDLEGVTDLNNPHLEGCDVVVNYDGNRESKLTNEEQEAFRIVTHNREMAIEDALDELEKAVDIRDDKTRADAVRRTLPLFEGLPSYDVAAELTERFRAHKLALDNVIKCNIVLDVAVKSILVKMLENSINLINKEEKDA